MIKSCFILASALVSTVILVTAQVPSTNQKPTTPPENNAGKVNQTPPWAVLPRNAGILPFYDSRTTPLSPPPAGLYVAMGDSITFGKGVTNNCQAFPTHPVDIESSCPDGQSYVSLVAKALRKAGIAGRVMNLGINGAQVPRVTADELPYLPAETTLVTIYIGTNDSRLVRNPQVSVDSTIANFEQGYDDLLTKIHQKAPKARIVLINFPNQKGLAGPFHLADDIVARYDLTSQAMDAFIDRHYPQYAVVSTVCNTQSYDQTLQFRGSVHPNEAGTAILAKEVTDVILSKNPPAPPSTCEWLNPASLTSSSR